MAAAPTTTVTDEKTYQISPIVTESIAHNTKVWNFHTRFPWDSKFP